MGFVLDSKIFFIFKNFSSPNLLRKKSENKIVLFGLLGALFGLNMACAKLKLLAETYFLIFKIFYINNSF